MENSTKSINMIDAVKLFLKTTLISLAELAEANIGGLFWPLFYCIYCN